MTTINSNKIQSLNENYRQYISSCSDTMSFSDYVIRESENDPTFFSWLFDDESLEDRTDLDMDQNVAWENYIADITGADMAEESSKEICKGNTYPGNSYSITVERNDNGEVVYQF